MDQWVAISSMIVAYLGLTLWVGLRAGRGTSSTVDGFVAGDRTALKIHQRVHAPPTFICPTCNMGFRGKHVLKTHMLQHTGELPFKCDLCENYRAKSSSVLRKHFLKHHAKNQ